MRYSAARLILSLIVVVPAFGGRCHFAKIYFGSGIWTDAERARIIMRDELKPRLETRIAVTGYPVDTACLEYEAKPATNNYLADLYEESLRQALVQNESTFLKWTRNILAPPLSFQRLAIDQALRINELTYKNDPNIRVDLDRFVREYKEALKDNSSIVLVAHSQGNFYGNDTYKEIFGSYAAPSNGRFSIIPVATPASIVAGATAPFQPITVFQDFIWLVPGALSWTETNTPLNCFTPYTCHFFDSAYLTGAQTSVRILDAIINAITQAPEVRIDGNNSEWQGIPVAVTDPIEGFPWALGAPNNPFPWQVRNPDIIRVKVTNDRRNLYFLIESIPSTVDNGSAYALFLDLDSSVSTGCPWMYPDPGAIAGAEAIIFAWVKGSSVIVDERTCQSRNQQSVTVATSGGLTEIAVSLDVLRGYAPGTLRTLSFFIKSSTVEGGTVNQPILTDQERTRSASYTLK